MKKILFIVNPVSGGKSKKPYLEAIDRFLDKEVYSYRRAFTEYSGHASELARDCEEDTVVAVGGDGTVSEVARGLIGTGKTFGIMDIWIPRLILRSLSIISFLTLTSLSFNWFLVTALRMNTSSKSPTIWSSLISQAIVLISPKTSSSGTMMHIDQPVRSTGA